MTDTNQKLREALRIAVNYIDMDALYTFAGGDHDTIKEALATTEPEPTGMPPAPEPDIHYIYIGLGWKPATAQQYAETHRQKCAMHSTIQLQTYGKQCWKAGCKHGAWGGDAKDAERYRWLRDDTDSDWAICEWSHAPGDEGYYRDARAPHIVDAAIDAAMAQGVKG